MRWVSDICGQPKVQAVRETLPTNEWSLTFLLFTMHHGPKPKKTFGFPPNLLISKTMTLCHINTSMSETEIEIQTDTHILTRNCESVYWNYFSVPIFSHAKKVPGHHTHTRFNTHQNQWTSLAQCVLWVRISILCLCLRLLPPPPPNFKILQIH